MNLHSFKIFSIFILVIALAVVFTACDGYAPTPGNDSEEYHDLNIEVVEGEGTTDPKPGNYREKEGSDVPIEVIPDEEEGEEVLMFNVNEEDKRAELMNPPEYKYIVTIKEDTTVEVKYFCPI